MISGCILQEKKPTVQIEDELEAKAFIEEWMALCRQHIMEEAVTPPEASRVLAYMGVAGYETLAQAFDDEKGFTDLLSGNPKLPSGPEEVYDPVSAMAQCYFLVLQEALNRHLATYERRPQSLLKRQLEQREKYFSHDEIERSTEHGKRVAEALIDWMKKDGYSKTRTYAFYQSPTRVGNPAGWETTDFGQVPMEPYWSTHRLFMLEDVEICPVDSPVQFSSAPGSKFYEAVNELVKIDRNITPEQMEIAFFWADCPGDTPTPPGHWSAIIGELSVQKDLSLIMTAKAHALVGIGMADGFITCWKMKYKYNLVRPKTYIHDFIGPADWEPFVETPPFPEYTAGHSTISNTAAGILEGLLGDSVAFTDSFHVAIGLSPRSFNSIREASREASLSRVYGGIHYRFTVEASERQAGCIVERILNKTKERI